MILGILASAALGQVVQGNIEFSGKETVLEGHTSAVVMVQYGADSKALFSASGSELITWDGDNKKSELPLEGPSAASANGESLAAATIDSLTLYADGGARLVKQYQSVEYFGFANSDMLTMAAFSKDGKRLAVCGFQDLAVIITPLTDARKPIRLKHGSADCIALSPDGTLFATGNTDGTVSIYNSDSGEQFKEIEGFNKTMSYMTFSPNGKLLAAGSEDGVGKVWKTSDWTDLRKLSAKGILFSLAFTPDSKALAYTYNLASQRGAIEVINMEDGKVIASSPKLNFWVFSLAFSPDGKRLAAGGEDSDVHIWYVK